MCIVYNQIGSLKTIKSHLSNNNVNEFNSVNEIILFQKNYYSAQQQIIASHTKLIEHEKSRLKKELEELKDLVGNSKNATLQMLNLELKELKLQFDSLLSKKSNFFIALINYLKKRRLKKKIQNIENNFELIVAEHTKGFNDSINTKTIRYSFLESHFSDAVNQSANTELKELDKKKEIVDQLRPFVLGAIGENKVSKELENLSDDYILINDFNCSFHPAIYNQRENDYIKSVQIDHILIAPSGIFLIETKNWSDDSIKNINLRSPISQIKRSSFALFNILNRHSTGILGQHHWGKIKLPIRNVIVLINQKPLEEFDFVKVLTLKELKNYIEYFKPIFSTSDTKKLADVLLRINE